jgi:pyrroline-5-carboxylate reductase
MPNTPALIGKGITALFARAAVNEPDKALVNQVLGSTGELMWVGAEDHIDAVTALSGSGPAYMFYFMEAMRESELEELKKDVQKMSESANFTNFDPLADVKTQLNEVGSQVESSLNAPVAAVETADLQAPAINSIPDPDPLTQVAAPESAPAPHHAPIKTSGAA